jgi:hypothetical protein
MSMNARDRQAIEQLFARLAEVEQQSPSRDLDAESFIQQQMARQPGSAYYMAQSIVALEQALNAANQRLEEAERQSSRGSLMPGAVPRVGPSGANQSPPPEASGPGFLAGALQTALAVAGGTLLGSSIGSIFGADRAKASEARRDETSQAADHRDDEDDNDGDDDHEGGGGFLDSIFGGGDKD